MEEVRAVLAGWLGQTPKLDEYTERLVSEGRHTVEMLHKLTEEEMVKLGFDEPHIKNIIHHINTNNPSVIGATGAHHIVRDGHGCLHNIWQMIGDHTHAEASSSQ